MNNKYEYEKSPQVQIYDSTLREGFQTPGGIGASNKERLFAAHHIAKYCDWIELGMPANPVDYQIIGEIRDSFAQHNTPTGIAVLCRLMDYDIDSAAEVASGVPQAMAHVFKGVSTEHVSNRGKARDSNEKYITDFQEFVGKAAAKQEFSHIMVSPEDGIRAYMQDPEFGRAVIAGSIAGYQRSGRKSPLIVNMPDTTGGKSVLEFLSILHEIQDVFGDAITLSTHSHNDSGMANAHSLEAALCGIAPYIQTTFGQLGERNGIAQTENIIAMLYARNALTNKPYGDATVLRDLVPTARAVMAALGREIPAESLVSGFRTNVSTAGIHTDLVVKDTATYHIHGEGFGAVPQTEFGPTSGAHQVIPVLDEIGIHKTKAELVEFVDALKIRSNSEKRAFTQTEIRVEGILEFTNYTSPLKITDYTIPVSNNAELQSDSQIVYVSGTYNEAPFEREVRSTGPIEGIFDAFSRVIGEEIKLHRFRPMVTPKLPDEYLEWADAPKLPTDLDVHSQLRVHSTVGVNGALFSGYNAQRNSLRAMIESPLNAICNMEFVRGWMKQSGQ